MNSVRAFFSSTMGRIALPVALVAFAALLPMLNIYVPGVMPGPSYQAGAQQMFAYAFLIAALALSYHLMFGLAGMLSFGHAMFFGLGAYGLAISLKQLAPRDWGTPVTFVVAIVFTLVLGFVVATIAGAVALRVSGITFAMVTLAFAQALNVLARRNPGRLTGGEEGISVTTSVVPDALVGVRNTENLYWMALGVLVLVYLITLWVEKSRVGTVTAAARDNDLRVRVLGLQPYLVRLFVATAAAVLAVIAGIAFVLLQSGTTPRVTTSDFTLTLLVIVVLGGVGYRWGAIVGALVYTLLDQRLSSLANSEFVENLPPVLHVPLSEPLFILGTLFVLVVMFVPGGIAGTVTRLGRRPAHQPGIDALDTAEESTAKAGGAGLGHANA
ncbi:branched-chain amino acid ABC transporter permease [Propionibacteriaceae bacterium G1746]